MARLERAGMAQCAPKLNAKGDPNKWLSDQQAPWKKLANESPKARPSPMTRCCRRGRRAGALSAPLAADAAARRRFAPILPTESLRKRNPAISVLSVPRF